MGLACLRAEHLAAEPIQIAIWDGVAPEGPAGTGADVARLAAGGRAHPLVDPGAVDRGLARPRAAHRHRVRARAGGDPVHRFRGLLEAERERVLPAFWDGVMRIIADVLDAHGERGRLAATPGATRSTA